MLDKRSYYAILNGLKDFYPESSTLIESIQAKFDEVKPLTDKEKRSLVMLPIQYVKRIIEDDGEWTTQLHIWAENSVSEIINLDPIFLGFKNSRGDSVLMCLAIGATGTHTGRIDYELIRKILDKDYTYEDSEKTPDGNDDIIVRNAMDETDISGKRPVDYLADIAFAKGDYANDEPDLLLIEILSEYNNRPTAQNDVDPSADEQLAPSSQK